MGWEERTLDGLPGPSQASSPAAPGPEEVQEDNPSDVVRASDRPGQTFPIAPCWQPPGTSHLLAVSAGGENPRLGAARSEGAFTRLCYLLYSARVRFTLFSHAGVYRSMPQTAGRVSSSGRARAAAIIKVSASRAPPWPRGCPSRSDEASASQRNTWRWISCWHQDRRIPRNNRGNTSGRCHRAAMTNRWPQVHPTNMAGGGSLGCTGSIPAHI